MSAYVEDQNVDPAAPQKDLVRGEQSGCSLSEQLISSTSYTLAQQSLTTVPRLFVAGCHCSCLSVRCASIHDAILMHLMYGQTSGRRSAETQHAGCHTAEQMPINTSIDATREDSGLCNQGSHKFMFSPSANGCTDGERQVPMLKAFQGSGFVCICEQQSVGHTHSIAGSLCCRSAGRCSRAGDKETQGCEKDT